MNLHQIDCFFEVARTLSFSEASRSLFLSQSTVSAQVSALEKEFGFELFERDRHHVSLTRAGEYLYARLPDQKRVFERVIERARDIAGSGREMFRLGYDGPLAEAWVGSAIEAFGASEPDVDIVLTKRTIGELTEMLADDALDAAVSAETEAAGFEFAPLCTAGPCVYVSRSHRLAGMGSVRAEDLVGEHIISPYGGGPSTPRSRTAAVLEAHGIPLREARSCDDGDTAFMSVQAGMGVFVASRLCDEFARRYDVVALDLDAGLGPAVLGLIWRTGVDHVDSMLRCLEYAIARRGRDRR